MENYSNYLLLAAVVLYFGWRYKKGRDMKATLPDLMKDGAIIVDVRSPGEFASGHAPNSINIPLPQLKDRLSQLDSSKTIVLCCASGTRSGMAVATLKQNGFSKVVNAGPWTNVAM